MSETSETNETLAELLISYANDLRKGKDFEEVIYDLRDDLDDFIGDSD